MGIHNVLKHGMQEDRHRALVLSVKIRTRQGSMTCTDYTTEHWGPVDEGGKTGQSSTSQLQITFSF
jgi:hypothetical protein